MTDLPKVRKFVAEEKTRLLARKLAMVAEHGSGFPDDGTPSLVELARTGLVIRVLQPGGLVARYHLSDTGTLMIARARGEKHGTEHG